MPVYSATVPLAELIVQFHQTWVQANHESRRWHQIVLVKQIFDLDGQDGIRSLAMSENIEISTLRNYLLVGQSITPEIVQQYKQLNYSIILEAIWASRKFSHAPQDSVTWWLEQVDQHRWNLKDFRQFINKELMQSATTITDQPTFFYSKDTLDKGSDVQQSHQTPIVQDTDINKPLVSEMNGVSRAPEDLAQPVLLSDP